MADYRQPVARFLRPGMKLLDIGANERTLKSYLERQLNFAIDYKGMDIDRTHGHDFYDLEEISEEFDAITCFEVVEHMSPSAALELFQIAFGLLKGHSRLSVSTPNVYHPMSFWSDCTHVTLFRLRHLAG